MTLKQGNKSVEEYRQKLELYTLRLNLEEDKNASISRSWPKKEATPKVAFKDHSKSKEEKTGKLITNPTRCFKCNGVGHIAINFPTKRTLVFNEDLNGWIEKNDDDCKEGIVHKDANSEDQAIASFEVLALVEF
ncbi:hypothetical protein M9H77_35361 [Catharanthus roseus]|uniref:Uncharacterized protein n=1 Tax=Catharanthus roseus TaxID=4058 RepID=A0ACB9ZNT9_CATRO|nr:hypothetical protein M9H77_35361 [Catharanthus roseus]